MKCLTMYVHTYMVSTQLHTCQDNVITILSVLKLTVVIIIEGMYPIPHGKRNYKLNYFLKLYS